MSGLTVITLPPAGVPSATRLSLGGWADDAADRVMPVDGYDLLITPDEVPHRVAQLDAQVRRELCHCSELCLMGWSQGARIIAALLRQWAICGGPDPERVWCLLLGNPERPGGACSVLSPPRKTFGLIRPRADFGGPGIPESTPYHVADLGREWGGWEDVPIVQCPTREALGLCDDAYHMDYFNVSLRANNIQQFQQGSILYGLWPTTRPPWSRPRYPGALEEQFWRPYDRCGPLPDEWRRRLRLCA